MIKKEYINLANILTFSRIVLGFIFLAIFVIIKSTNHSIIFSFVMEILSFLLFIVAIITDGLDGYFARKNKEVTDFGKHFDPLADSIFFIIVFFTFVFIKLMPVYFFVLLILREGFMHLFLRPYTKRKGSTLPASIFGKIKTVFQCVLSLIILFLMIVKSLLIVIKIDYNKIFLLRDWWIETISFVFFAIIVFLSLLSLATYLINLKKTINNN
ncbi:MAG TPA: CDP-diacylglycerol--glycerol-3-phosphate 3-phosphatidyltransferase [Spirochaetota bacterium]|nr:CDP-diacylglycerol--glycerol-3-phosphate 3-phosphatidyltransferase [Spirochaetota bacterium]